jgi:hypothetical protein
MLTAKPDLKCFSVGPTFIGCSKWASNKAAGAGPTAGVALGYVEDGDKPRTQLGSIFSILMI